MTTLLSESADVDLSELDSAVVMAMESLEGLNEQALLSVAQEDAFEARATAARILVERGRAAGEVLKMIRG